MKESTLNKLAAARMTDERLRGELNRIDRAIHQRLASHGRDRHVIRYEQRRVIFAAEAAVRACDARPAPALIDLP